MQCYSDVVAPPLVEANRNIIDFNEIAYRLLYESEVMAKLAQDR